MRAFGNPIGNPVQGGDGGQGTKIGDIVFAKKAPSSNFIPIVNQRVYADQYPRLADVLQVRRENDGGEWLRPGGIFPNVDPSGGRYFRPLFGGVSAGQNVLVMYNNDGGQHVVARGEASGKIFDSLSILPGNVSGGSARMVGAVSENGTTVMLQVHTGGDGSYSGIVYRSADGLRTASAVEFAVAGLGAANRFNTAMPYVLSMGGDVWIIINYLGDVFRSDDDGRNWRLVKTITWTGIQFQGSAFNEPRTVVSAIAVGGRIWVANGNPTQNAGNGTQEDALVYSDDLFETYGRLRLFDSGTNLVIGKTLGMLGPDLVLLQTRRTNSEVQSGAGNRPLRGLYIQDANPSNAPSIFEMSGTDGADAGGQGDVFSWDGIGYMAIPQYGFFRVQPRTLIKTLMARGSVSSGDQWTPGSFLRFANFALVWSYSNLRLSEWSAAFLQAVPTAMARRYYQFSEASVVGAQRSDGKLPFMRAR